MKASLRTLGFTLMELLVVMAIILMISGFALIGFRNYANYQRYDQEIGSVKTAIMNARADARSAVSDKAHGVHFSTSSLTIFEGTTYSASSPTNEVVNFKFVTLSTNLRGGTSDVVFSRLTGAPSATGTITVTGTRYVGSSTIDVTAAGVIQ